MAQGLLLFVLRYVKKVYWVSVLIMQFRLWLDVCIVFISLGQQKPFITNVKMFSLFQLSNMPLIEA